MQDKIVIVGSARLPAGHGSGKGESRLIMEVVASQPDFVCADLALTPPLALVERLLKDVLVGRRVADFPDACEEIRARYLGVLQGAVLAAVRSAASALTLASADVPGHRAGRE